MIERLDASALGPVELASLFWVAAVFAVMVAAIRRAERVGLDGRVMFWTAVWGLAGAWVGGHWYCLLDAPEAVARRPALLLDVLGGEKAFFGALLGAAIGGIGYLSIRSHRVWAYVDAAVPPVALGYVVFRVGCMLNGCELGAPADLPWSTSGPDGLARHPVALYHGLAGLGVYGLVRRGKPGTGGPLIAGLALYGGARFGLEFVRVEPIAWAGLHPGHWLSLVLIVLAAGVWTGRGKVAGSPVPGMRAVSSSQAP